MKREQIYTFHRWLLQIKTTIILFFLLTLLTGLLYPGLVTLIAQSFFSDLANGSLIKDKGRIVGSRLIGQPFEAPHYFWGRPSATEPFPYNAALSSGSNLGPSNSVLLNLVKARKEILINNLNLPSIPVELVTASGSGLDPEISPWAAIIQIPRIAKIRNIPVQMLETLVQKNIKQRSFWILGEPRVNVLELNLALDKLTLDKKPNQGVVQP